MISLSRNKAYKISVVIPVCNAETYLEETIESVIDQTIGFEENIQLILVSNVSENTGEEICKRYLDKYPENVVFHKTEEDNGPGSVRNAGMVLAEGKYLSFLDPDDKWDRTAFEKACSFFDEHYDEIDMVSCRIRLFDALNKWHELDWKFKEGEAGKLINIQESYQYIQPLISSTIIKREAAVNYRFDERVRHSEDTKFITEFLLDKQKYALLKDAVYYLRTCSYRDSMLQKAQACHNWYLETPKYVCGYLFEESKKRYGYVLRYLQAIAMYDLQSRLDKPLLQTLTSKEVEDYRNVIKDLLQDIDDEVINDKKIIHAWREFKIYALSLKYGKPVKENYQIRSDGSIYFNDIQLYESYPTSVEVACVNISNHNMVLEGRFLMVLPEHGKRLVCVCSGMEYECEMLYLNETEKRYSLGELIHEKKGFRVIVPLASDKTTHLSFKLYYKETAVNIGISYAFICKLTGKMDNSYWRTNGHVIKPVGIKSIEVHPYSKKLCRQFERNLEKELADKNKKNALKWRRRIRFMNCVFKHRKPIWIFTDYFEKAGDNAEVLFNYVNKNHGEKAKTYFVIDEKSEDYPRLKKAGRVINADSEKYRLYFALADKVISSQSFYNRFNTFCKDTELLQDLFRFDFVYLQHGVIKDNHADTQSKIKKNLDIFVTSASKEKDSIIKGIGGNYLYDESVVKVTGLARFDLIDPDMIHADKKVLLAPTWRKEGVGPWDDKTQSYPYSEQFKNTEFFQYYNSLINDPRLISVLKEKGYTMYVRFHPRMIQQASDFAFNDQVKIETVQNDYVEEMKNTSLLITDYSSIAFDYAYAYIPVVYSQFDKERFYSNHAYQRGYYDYEKDGFGEVCYDYESTIEAVIRSIENNCTIEAKYKERVDQFFAYHDHKNCERIYNEIIKLDEAKHSGS